MMRVVKRWLGHFRAPLVFVVVAMTAVLVLVAFAVPADIEWKQKCEAAGGVNASSEHRYLCVRKSAVIEIKP